MPIEKINKMLKAIHQIVFRNVLAVLFTAKASDTWLRGGCDAAFVKVVCSNPTVGKTFSPRPLTPDRKEMGTSIKYLSQTVTVLTSAKSHPTLLYAECSAG